MADYSIRLEFKNVTAGSNFTLSIFGSDPGAWSLGDSGEREAGLRVRSLASEGDVQFNSLNVSAKQIVVYAGEEDVNVELDLFVSTSGKSVGGEATLPSGASCTIVTDADQQNVLASGSWGVALTS